jgi:hypothetical protein
VVELTDTERQELYLMIPVGRQGFYQSFREAGIRNAKPLRNIPWVLAADDGTTIFCLWRSYMRPVASRVAAQMDVRRWTDTAKGRDVQVSLAASLGKKIRVIVVEDGSKGSKTARSTSFDPYLWNVNEGNGDYLLTRSESLALAPGTPHEFTQRMLDLYEDSKSELNYRASYFLRKVRTDGGVAAAKSWLSGSKRPTEGFENLYSKRRLDLSVEAIVLAPRWSGLFTTSELEAARARLDEYGYFRPSTKGKPNPADSNADEIDPTEEFPEGMRLRVEVNAYERDPKARAACIARYGVSCVVCEFDFGKRFGVLGAGYIHVHHLNPVSKLGAGAKTNPIRDLRPVCPNCHSMLHKESPPMPIGKLRTILTHRTPANKNGTGRRRT